MEDKISNDKIRAAKRNERCRERRWEKDQEMKESNPELWQQKRDARNERKRMNNKELKEQNPELWQQKRDERNEQRREQRRLLKEENSEKLEAENKQQREKAKIFREENPEEHRKKLAVEKKKRIETKVQTWNELFDKLFEENKSTFPTKVSKKEWENLKKSEIDFLLTEFDNISTRELIDYRIYSLDYLKKNPEHLCGGSIIFYIKTMVHRPWDQRKITDEEKEYINSLILPPMEIDDEKVERRRQYYEKKQEREKEYSKSSYEKKKSERVLDNLNQRFIDADPNKVLSLDDICHNPFISNFSDREEFKVNLYKSLSEKEKPEYLEKWENQRRIYEKEVLDLPADYKEEFIERMKDKDYFDEWEERKERRLNHFRVLEK